MNITYGVMAQLVERLVRNEEARGSNPLSSTKTKTRLSGRVFVLVDLNFACYKTKALKLLSALIVYKS